MEICPYLTRIVILLLFSLISIFSGCSPANAKSHIDNSIVKIYSECYPYSYIAPWQLDGPESGTGSGCIIAGKRILTNAHVVSNAKFVQVKRAGAKDKFVAEVEFIAHDCDLAVLKVKEENFFKGATPLQIGSLVTIRDHVTVYGFPEGGEALSVTEGIVSRVEVHEYAHSKAELLCGQIDAAINDGNSGGPVIKDGKIVGVAFQAGSGENIGYMVPSPVIQHFLKDIEDGRYDGIPSLEISWQTMENPDLRSKYGLSKEQTGLLVNKVYAGSPAEGLLKPGDVILGVADRDIASDGTIEFRKNERTLFIQRIQEFFLGDIVCLRVLREGKILTLSIKLTARVNQTRLVPHCQYDIQPSYYILGGLVFQHLTENYLDLWKKNQAPSNLRNYYLHGEPSKYRKKIVILASILADEVNVGYEDLVDFAIFKANGETISDLPSLVAAVESNTQRYHVFEDEKGRVIVLDREKARLRHAQILKRYDIPSDRSEDLKLKK
ncbi:MAG: serine protease [Clostridiales bacterium]|nr:serine protease [Clostridiales bacterium]